MCFDFIISLDPDMMKTVAIPMDRDGKRKSLVLEN